MNSLSSLSQEEFESLRPRIASDATIRHYENGIIAWSPSSPHPTPLNQVSAVVFQILDGSGTVAELIDDICAVVGISQPIARSQMRQVLSELASDGLLDGIEPLAAEPTEVDYFPAPPNP